MNNEDLKKKMIDKYDVYNDAHNEYVNAIKQYACEAYTGQYVHDNVNYTSLYMHVDHAENAFAGSYACLYGPSICTGNDFIDYYENDKIFVYSDSINDEYMSEDIKIIDKERFTSAIDDAIKFVQKIKDQYLNEDK